MREQDKLRNTLREYYDSREEPFSDDEWERASAYLSTEKRGRKIRTAAFIVTALIGAGSIAVFNLTKSTNNKTAHATLLAEQKLNTSSTQPLSSSKAATLTNLTTARKNDLNLSKKSQLSEYASTSTPEKNGNTPESTSGSSTTKSLPVSKPALTDSSLHSSKKENNPIHENREVNAQSVPVAVNTILPINKQPSNTADTSEEPVETAPTVIVNKYAHKNQSPLNEIQQISTEPIATAKIPPALNGPDTETTLPDSVTKGTEETSVMPDTNTFQLPQINNSNNEITISVADTLPVTSFYTALAGEGFFYEAGAAWLYGWKSSDKIDARGFSPLAGINYMNKLNNRCAFSFGLQYLQVRNLSNSSKTSYVSTYEYGEQSKVTVITPSTVHYLVAPLRLHYYTNSQNSFGAGINLAYLLNIDANVTSYDQKPGLKQNYKTIKLSGYTEGFSWFDSQLAFFYRRKISHSLGLQAEIFLGLNDVKQNEFFDLNQTERNSGAKLSIIYYAFRKTNRK